MKKTLTILGMVLLLAGCAKQQAYDDSAVWEKLANLEQRVSTLESSIRGIQSAVGEGKFVQKVQEITDAAGNVTGITVTYTTGEVVNLNIGNVDPEAGPVISVKLNGAGELCWAVDGVIIQQNGKDVTVYQYPVFEIGEDGHLYVTVDGEKTDLGNVKGEKGDPGQDGKDGQDGQDGQGGAIQDGIIKGITVGEENIEILLDETTITLPLTLAFKLVVEKTDYAVTSIDPIEVPYEIKNKTPQTVVDAYASNEFEVEVLEDKIVVTPATKNSFGDILLYADSKIGLTSIVKLHFEGEVFKPGYEPYSGDIDFMVEAEAGNLEVPVVSNVEFDVKSTDSWIQYVNTKAKKATIVLSVAENPKASVRTGSVDLVRKGTEELIMTIVIAQKAGDPTVNLSKNGTANCYVVYNAGDYKFKAVKGNSTESVGEVASVALVWETYCDAEAVAENSVIASVEFADGFVKFSTPETIKPGNALIAAKNAAGDILWSWHIWIPETEIATDTYGGLFGDGVAAMDRNVGALVAAAGSDTEADTQKAYGFMYQFGRKDPLMGASAVTSKDKFTTSKEMEYKSKVPFTIAESIKHPTQFAYNAATAVDPDWDGANWNSENTPNLWNSEKGEKTIYDPCPVGYRVPKRDSSLGFWTKTDWTFNLTNYWYKKGGAVFPYAGYLDDCGGDLSYPGVRNKIWGADEESAKNGYCLYLKKDAYNSASTHKACGGSVRCVAE